MAKLPGVGYTVLTAVSHAGNAHGQSPAPMDLTADPWAGRDPQSTTVDQAAMAKRYGPSWQAGVAGPHSNVWREKLAMAFAQRKAPWPVDYDKWDGIPIQREVDDARYSDDRRVLAVQEGPGPTEVPPATKLRGVGYTVLTAISHAGNAHGKPPVPMDLTADPWAGRDPQSTAVDLAAMARRYGPNWQAGVAGSHSNVWREKLAMAFAQHRAPWSVDYNKWDGIPIQREVDDARYSDDRRVLAVR
jgi:hypothetical protein